MKKKIIMTILIILIVFLIVASIITVSKVVIVKDILKKVETNLDEKTNFSITKTCYTDASFSIQKNDIDKDTPRALITDTYLEFSYDKNSKIVTTYDYMDGKTSYNYEKDNEGNIHSAMPYEYILSKNDNYAINNSIAKSLKDNLNFKNIFKYFITSEKIRNVDCYKIRLFSENSTLYIDKETGLLIKVGNLGKDSVTNDYYYSFDTVTDKTFDVYKELEANAKKDEETK